MYGIRRNKVQTQDRIEIKASEAKLSGGQGALQKCK